MWPRVFTVVWIVIQIAPISRSQPVKRIIHIKLVLTGRNHILTIVSIIGVVKSISEVIVGIGPHDGIELGYLGEL